MSISIDTQMAKEKSGLPPELLSQKSEEWKLARCGSLGASQVADAIAKTKTGYGASRANVMAQLITERLTGLPTEGYVNGPMQWGIENEPQARAAYCFRTDAEVQEVGLIRHPTIKGTHASPDGLIGDDGVLELKAPNTATHIDTLISGKVPGKYVSQCQWQLACTGRQWVDYVSFDPRLPERMRMFITRIRRDNDVIANLEDEVRQFLLELDLKLSVLTERFK